MTKEQKEIKDYCERMRNCIKYDGKAAVVVRWRESRMYGNCPRVEWPNGKRVCAVSGCGYDKLSAALAKLFCEFVDEERKDLVAQSSGAGVSVLKRVMFDAGFELEHTVNHYQIDVFTISPIQLGSS